LISSQVLFPANVFSPLEMACMPSLVAAVFVLASHRLFRRADSIKSSKDQVLNGLMLQVLSQ
jgi:carboxyl-terminal processing protease